MNWIRSKYYELTNWWFDLLRAREERRSMKELFEILMAEETPGCDVCDEDSNLCICGELGPDCD